MQHNDQGCPRSFVDVLYEVPALQERLSATCRSLRSSFCAQVRVISMSHAEGAYKLCCSTWPQLLMVVVEDTSGSKLASKLSAQWEFLMGMTLSRVYFCTPRKTAVMIRSRQRVHAPLVDLPKQHSAALSDFVHRYHDTVNEMTLWGPLVGCRVVQTLSHDVWPAVNRFNLHASPHFDAESVSYLITCLPNLQTIDIKDCSAAVLTLFRSGTAWPQLVSMVLADNQLDATAISPMPHTRWTRLKCLILSYNMIGVSGIQHLVACSWPHLEGLYLMSTGLDRPALCCLAEGQWPKLRWLDLTKNKVDAIGISHLTQGSWPLLLTLYLSEQGLDDEACSLLGVAYWATQNTDEETLVSCKSGLVQYPLLSIGIVKDKF